MHKEWRRGDSFHALANPAHEIGQSFVSPGIIGRIPDTNKRKRDESEAFFAQEKLLIEYWVSR